MERWLACTVLAAFILGDPAGAEEATGRDRYWIDAAALKWKIGDAPPPTALGAAGAVCPRPHGRGRWASPAPACRSAARRCRCRWSLAAASRSGPGSTAPPGWG